jgi:hypothetical protein
MEPARNLKRSLELGLAIPGILRNRSIDGLANHGRDRDVTPASLRAQPAHLILSQ